MRRLLLPLLVSLLMMTTVACSGGQRTDDGPQVRALPDGADPLARQDAALCDHGDRPACARLAMRYVEGDGVPYDLARGLQLQQSACRDEEPVPDECRFFVTDAPPEVPPLTTNQISTVVSRNREGLETCFAQTVLSVDPQEEGQINVRFEITAGGDVSRVTVTNTPFDAPFQDCIVPRLNAWEFPPTNSGDAYMFDIPMAFP